MMIHAASIFAAAIVATTPAALLVIDPVNPNHLTVRYSPFIDPSAYEWCAEVSEDLVHWFEFSKDPDSNTIVFLRGEPNTFVYLVGYPIQPAAGGTP